MRIFSALSLALATLTVALALAKPKPPRADFDKPVARFEGVAFRNASASGGISCIFVYDELVGTEFSASLIGIQQVLVAKDESEYWFWVRGHDPRRYYHCPSSEAEKFNMIPPLRPSFSRWILNREKESTSFRDGEYTVDITVRNRLVTKQIYILEGEVDTRVTVTAFQNSGGLSFPAMAILEMPGRGIELEVDMGPAEANPKDKPNTNPPKGKKGKSLAL